MTKITPVKRAIFYSALLVVSVALTIGYGLIIGGDIAGQWWFVGFFILFCILFAFEWFCRKGKPGFKILDYKYVLIFLAIFIIFSIFTYHYANRISLTFVVEYDAVVTDATYRGGGTVWFNDPQGNEKSAQLDDYRIIVFDDNSIVSVGDKIQIREMKGIFDVDYCIIIK
ncbi:MAG: hypothetical protein IJF54_01045 [Clostridia bacterium]|nr:hypothetical protein [Clostridia bacterium]